MKKVLLVLLLGAAIVLGSCKKDNEDPEPPHIVGNWEAGYLIFMNYPPGFESREGDSDTIAILGINNAAVSLYRLEINANGSYSTKISRIGAPTITGQGEWTLEDDVFTLTENDTPDTYAVEKNELDQLWLSFPNQEALLSDATIQDLLETHVTVEAAVAYLDSLQTNDPDAYAALHQVVQYDVAFAFERVD